MPNNRLSVLFDRKPRHSKSTSNLPSERIPEYQPAQPEWQQPRRSQSRQTLSVMQEYNFIKPLPPPPPLPTHTSNQTRRPIGQHQHRSSTTPVLYPPDELFLKMIRRRSASARLEEMRIQQEQKNDPVLARSLAIASAVPPMYLDAPPEYTSPESEFQPHEVNTAPRAPWITQTGPSPRHTGSRGTISKFREDELFLDNDLKLQIDETMAQYMSVSVTQPTPVASPPDMSDIVSPMNDIDHIYLERRKQKKREQRRSVYG